MAASVLPRTLIRHLMLPRPVRFPGLPVVSGWERSILLIFQLLLERFVRFYAFAHVFPIPFVCLNRVCGGRQCSTLMALAN